MAGSRVRKAGSMKVVVKVELASTDMAARLAKNGAVFFILSKVVELAVSSMGGRIPSGRVEGDPSQSGGYTCGDQVYVEKFCPGRTAVSTYRALIGKC